MIVYYCWQRNPNGIIQFVGREFASFNVIYDTIVKLRPAYYKLDVIPESCVKRLYPNYQINEIMELQ